MSATCTEYDLQEVNSEMEKLDAASRVKWAVGEFGGQVALSSSFGADSAVMLHLCARVQPDIRVITIDTGMLFPETIAFRTELLKRLNLNLRIYCIPPTDEVVVDREGQMWLTDPVACCSGEKRRLFDLAKKELGLRAWLTGIRREQTQTRQQSAIVGKDHLGLLKISPILDWTAEQVDDYLRQNDLPYHPLREKGYLSIGCACCTRPVKPGDDPRAGRWPGQVKTECGLHLHNSGSGI
jgi:phosphoadenosine phosphosulfate reductase